MINIEKGLKHEVAELICLKCLNRWVGVYPEETLLKNIECKCGEVGYVIKTGQTIEEVINKTLDPKKDKDQESEDKSGKEWGDFLWITKKNRRRFNNE